MKSICPLFPLLLCLAQADTEERVIFNLSRVEAHGEGNEEAAQVMPLVAKLNHSSILPLLYAMNQASPIGDNWIRAAIIKILQSSNSKNFPESKILKFLKDEKNVGSSRRAAFELLQDNRPGIVQSIIPSLLHDPEPSLRREAIAKILDEASLVEGDKQSIQLYQDALNHACEIDQIKEATKELKKRGIEIDLVELMGFIINWEIIGPFDNTQRKGFGTIYPPEQEKGAVDVYSGKNGEVEWNSISTTHSLGMIDVNQELGYIKEVLAYARTTFDVDKGQKAQFRLGSKNAWKIWVNGELLFARDEYHRGGTRVDQFVLDGELKKGENQILIKVCQNEQTQSWTKQWEFCLRVTDPTGNAIKQRSRN